MILSYTIHTNLHNQSSWSKNTPSSHYDQSKQHRSWTYSLEFYLSLESNEIPMQYCASNIMIQVNGGLKMKKYIKQCKWSELDEWHYITITLQQDSNSVILVFAGITSYCWYSIKWDTRAFNLTNRLNLYFVYILITFHWCSWSITRHCPLQLYATKLFGSYTGPIKK